MICYQYKYNLILTYYIFCNFALHETYSLYTDSALAITFP